MGEPQQKEEEESVSFLNENRWSYKVLLVKSEKGEASKKEGGKNSPLLKVLFSTKKSKQKKRRDSFLPHWHTHTGKFWWLLITDTSSLPLLLGRVSVYLQSIDTMWFFFLLAQAQPSPTTAIATNSPVTSGAAAGASSLVRLCKHSASHTEWLCKCWGKGKKRGENWEREKLLLSESV